MKRLGKVKIEWSPRFAYAIGLIVTDGNLSIDRRHIDFTSKDRDLVVTFKKCLGLKNKIGKKARAREDVKKYYRVQFGDRNFYEFLLSIGIIPAKSKKLGELQIKKQYFADFLRGCFDGDGSLGAFHHPESQYLQIRIKITSASLPFLYWLQKSIRECVAVRGGWIDSVPRAWQLVYGKADALALLRFIYYSSSIPYLKRKQKIAKTFLRM